MSPQYDEAEQFMELQLSLLKRYEAVLSEKFKKDTVNKHLIVLHVWVYFVYGYHDITKFEELTVALCGSKFHSKIYKLSGEQMALVTIQNILKPYLRFADDIMGLNNSVIYRWLK